MYKLFKTLAKNLIVSNTQISMQTTATKQTYLLRSVDTSGDISPY